MSQFQHKEIGDIWNGSAVLALWLLYLSRSIEEDQALSGQISLSELTPQRVQQSECELELIDLPKVCISGGWAEMSINILSTCKLPLPALTTTAAFSSR